MKDAQRKEKQAARMEQLISEALAMNLVTPQTADAMLARASAQVKDIKPIKRPAMSPFEELARNIDNSITLMQETGHGAGFQ